MAQLFVLRWISPSDMGYWQTVAILEAYAMILRFGVINGLNRELPHVISTGDMRSASGYVDTAFSHSFAVSAVIFAASMGAYVFVRGDEKLSLTFLVFAFVAPMHIQTAFAESVYRTGKHFSSLGRIRMIQVPLVVASLVLPWSLGYLGFCIRALIIAAAAAGLALWRIPIRPQFGLNGEFLKPLIKTGMPLHMAGYAKSVSLTFTRVVLLYSAGSAAVGAFAPATYVYSMVVAGLGAYGPFLFPSLIEAAVDRPSTVARQTLGLIAKLLVVTAPVCTLAYFLVPPVFSVAFPAYSEGVGAAQTAVAAAWADTALLGAMCFVALKNWRVLAIHTLGLVGIRAVVPLVLFPLIENKIGAAGSSLLVSSVLGALLTAALLWSIHRRATVL